MVLTVFQSLGQDAPLAQLFLPFLLHRELRVSLRGAIWIVEDLELRLDDVVPTQMVWVRPGL